MKPSDTDSTPTQRRKSRTPRFVVRRCMLQPGRPIVSHRPLRVGVEMLVVHPTEKKGTTIESGGRNGAAPAIAEKGAVG